MRGDVLKTPENQGLDPSEPEEVRQSQANGFVKSEGILGLWPSEGCHSEGQQTRRFQSSGPVEQGHGQAFLESSGNVEDPVQLPGQQHSFVRTVAMGQDEGEVGATASKLSE